MRRKNFAYVILFISLSLISRADATPKAHYLANEGVLITNGEVKVLFDPLFDNSYGIYQLLPTDMQEALFAGTPPYDGIDAIFISHHHGDHFSPALMLSFLKAREDIRLYAPKQAVTALRAVAGAEDEQIFDRVTGLALNTGDESITLTVGDLLIEATRIPHSGWPVSRTDIENIAFRVTLNKTVTVLHLGDAAPNPAHFLSFPEHWEDHEPNLALPPYWFFGSKGGQYTLSEYIKPAQSIGIHVPTEMPKDPADRPAEIRDYDLFTTPGESRTIAAK